MKKIAALFLLFIFLFNTVGYFIVFQIEECQIKNEIKSEIEQGVNPDEITELIIPKNNSNDIELIDGGDEIRYDNELFDIVKSDNTSSSTIYYCINDKQEESLFTNLENSIDLNIISNKSMKNDSSKKLVDIVIKIYYSNQFAFSLTQIHSSIPYFTSKLIYTPALLETDSPPPEFV